MGVGHLHPEEWGLPAHVAHSSHSLGMVAVAPWAVSGPSPSVLPGGAPGAAQSKDKAGHGHGGDRHRQDRDPGSAM